MVSRAKSPTTPIPTRPPSEADIRAALGEAYEHFQELVTEAGAGAAEWRQYTRNSPWVLKVSEGRRSLFYAQPDGGQLRVTVLLGERAVEAALAGGVSKALQESIRSAKRYPEGRPVTVLVKRPSDLDEVDQLIAVKRAAAAGANESKSRPRRGRRTRRS